MPRNARDFVASRLQAIRPSPTLAVTSLAARLTAQGEEIISFGAGEPDLETPASVRQAAIEAIHANRGRYTAAAGLTELRQAVARKLESSGFSYSWKQVACTSGAKSALFLALYVLLEPGEEVIFPSPHWGSYEDMVSAAGGVPVPVPCRQEDDFQPDPDRLHAAVTERTRVLMLNSPNNPTGALYGRKTLEGLAEVAREHDLAIVSDDIYEHLIYTGEPFENVLNVAPDRGHATVLVNGFSKAFSMTGWRLGWLAGPEPVMDAVIRLQSQVAGNASTIAQLGGIAGLADPPGADRVETFDRRRRLMLEELARIPLLRCSEPLGAFYAFPDVSAYVGRQIGGRRVDGDEAIVQLLLEVEKVAAVPGSAFGAPGHIRLTYACSEDVIREGVGRIGRLLARLEP